VVLVNFVGANEAVDRQHICLTFDHEICQRLDDYCVALDIAVSQLLGNFQLEFTSGDDEETIADVCFRQSMMLHGGGDARVHGVAVVLEVDEGHAQGTRHVDAEQWLARRLRQCLDDGDTALAGSAGGCSAADCAAKKMLAVEEVPHRDRLFVREVVRLGSDFSFSRHLATYRGQFGYVAAITDPIVHVAVIWRLVTRTCRIEMLPQVRARHYADRLGNSGQQVASNGCELTAVVVVVFENDQVVSGEGCHALVGPLMADDGRRQQSGSDQRLCILLALSDENCRAGTGPDDGGPVEYDAAFAGTEDAVADVVWTVEDCSRAARQELLLRRIDAGLQCLV